jgi:2-hydroxy-6-oxonona-2,4-dienedioate hydrolase
LYGGSASTPPRRFEPIETTISRLKAVGIGAAAGGIVRTWFKAGDQDTYHPLCLAATEKVTTVTAIAALTAVSRWDVRARLGEVQTPTLVICGDADRSSPPDDACQLWRAIPGAQLCVVPGCAHNVYLERSDLFNRILSDFLLLPAA